ncbi:unnamed protein product [Chilo suppressalis]|uniref:Uncharacterized protein n=1 Tax=Chilo suppressalis TaxID=168631 RepID=A0ABN8B7P8_CHISP|nr:unnamed protein product [Chilo suppressalis]
MYYVDSQRALTRRESSLLTSRGTVGDDKTEYDVLSLAPPQLIFPLASESVVSDVVRPKGSIRNELITMMFESMLDCIVESWTVIVPPKLEGANQMQFEKTPSELTYTGRKKERKSIVKPQKSSRRSKVESSDVAQIDPMQQIWWSSPDERAIIKFRNGNIYEGSISMKCMHGHGRFQWANGTVYLGDFKDNKISGKGMIQWKDDSWYEGDFVGNIRHGRGLYVDSRNQRCYAGGWFNGTKHGEGVIHFSKSFKNSYDGHWDHNVRDGFGSREYSHQSGYKGEWDQYVREGNGIMIWPNHDFYSGQWKNGVMSGYGIYIWDAYYNNSLALPSVCAYRGNWLKGQRSGYGILNLGLGMGSYYKGEFKNNNKHGVGQFVTNNGMILQNKQLFIDDNFGTMKSDEDFCNSNESKQISLDDPYKFDICDNSVGYYFHVEDALRNIDKQIEVRENMISDYIKNNKLTDADLNMAMRKDAIRQGEPSSVMNIDGLIDFEEDSLRKAIRCYEIDLKKIYYQYATVCNTEEIQFTPVLIRLFLWQFYYDCNIHEKGLTLIDIDKMFHRNLEWLSKSAHNPFEKIYFWQFLHSLISIASKLYAKRELPGPKPDTILASGFRSFMERDILPNIGRRKGRLVDVYGQFLPLKGLYALYRSLGEPHSVRDFLCAVRRPPHDTDKPQPSLVDAPGDNLPIGRNAYILGDRMIFVANNNLHAPEVEENNNDESVEDLKLFNFGNLSSKAIINIFSGIFPQLSFANKIMNLDISLTFFEFFEAFIACAEESIRVTDEELQWQDRYSARCNPVTTPVGHTPKSK